ncbi:MAG: hypothetical protein ACR2JU_10925 [Nocardioidaceae bacterium]
MSENSTLECIPAPRRKLVSTWATRSFVGLLFLLCVAGGVGLLGGHTSTAVSAKHGFHLSLQYPRTARPGLDTLWELKITHAGGFSSPITVAVSGSYFDLFETQGFYPTPSETTRDNTFVYLTFTPPKSAGTFRVMYDAYVQPYVSPDHLLAQRATVALIIKGHRLDAIDYVTWLLP